MQVAYGVECLWWDIAARAVEKDGRTVCPHCGGVVYFYPDKATLLRIARRVELIGFVRHQELMEWVRGRCFKTRKDAWNAYTAESLRAVLAGGS